MRANVEVDGSGNSPRGSSCAAILYDELGRTIAEAGKRLPKCTNNEAEYEAVILGIKTAIKHGVTELAIFSDSQLVVSQLSEEWAIKTPHLVEYRDRAWEMALKLDKVSITWFPREQNYRADRLANSYLPKKAIAVKSRR